MAGVLAVELAVAVRDVSLDERGEPATAERCPVRNGLSIIFRFLCSTSAPNRGRAHGTADGGAREHLIKGTDCDPTAALNAARLRVRGRGRTLLKVELLAARYS